MKTIALFGGTSEGRILAETAADAGVTTDVFVAGSYGAHLLPVSERIRVHAGRLDASEMVRTLSLLSPELVLDATHPYAVEVSENVAAASRKLSLPCCRVRREGILPAELLREEAGVLLAEDAAEAAGLLCRESGRIFFTTGTKDIAVYAAGIPDFARRAVVRALPDERALGILKSTGLAGRQIILMQGPFSRELNEAMFRDSGAAVLVTKDSGTAGGLREKLEAAQHLCMKIVVIGPPQAAQEESGQAGSLLSLRQAQQLLVRLSLTKQQKG